MARGAGWTAAVYVASICATAACAGSRPEPVEPFIPTARASSPAEPAQTDPSKPAQAETGAPAVTRQLQAALAKVVAARGLELRRPLTLRNINGANVRAYVRDLVQRELPPHARAGTNALLVALGQAPSDFDFGQALEALMSSALAGLYDPEKQIMFLRDGLTPEQVADVLYHELSHALQDQYYDLRGQTRQRDDANDRIAALHGLAEGDASSVQWSITGAPEPAFEALDAISESGVPAEAALPSVVERMILAPYRDGFAFVRALRQRGGWPLVDEAWKRPPESTEQLMHPAKYATREPAESIAVPVLPNSVATYHDVIGEQLIRVFLEQWLVPGDAALAAADWSGDRLAVLVWEGRQLVTWHLRYDSVTAAQRVAHALMLGAAVPAHTLVPLSGAVSGIRNGAFCLLRSEQGPYAVVTRQRDITLVLGPRKNSHSRNEIACPQALRWANALQAP